MKLSHDIAKRFGRNVRKIRITIGMTQQTLATLSHTAPTQISHYEAEERAPSLATAERISRALLCGIDRLIKP